MIFFRALHFVLRHFTELDNKILYKLQDTEKQCISRETERFSDCLPEKSSFFTRINIITHAGGGLQGMSYLNCKDAFSFYYDNGNRVFEYDVDLSSDGKFICSHSDKSISEKEHLNKKIDNRFYPISIEDCLRFIEVHKDIKVIFDCKFNDLEPFARFIKDSLKLKEDLSRVVIQVFSEENIKQVRSVWDFHMLYVCLNNTDFFNAARLCVQYNIPAVSISVGSIKNRTGWQVFGKANICTFVYTVNTVKQFGELRQSGIDGVFSDFLFDEDVKAFARND